jgi:hypothetical protein
VIHRFCLSLLIIGSCFHFTAFAEEKMVTPPLVTQLSSTTISGNVVVQLPNGKTTSVTPRDLLCLRSAIKSKNQTFVSTFIAMKQRLAGLDANQFDGKYLQLLLSFSNVRAPQVRGFGGRSSVAPF